MLKAEDYIPSLKQGAKILPQNIAGMASMPVVNEIFFVDALNGSDTNNGGKKFNDAFKTLEAAHAAMTDANYELAYIAPSGVGTGSGTSEDSAIDFSKSLCSVIGAAAPSMQANRSRVLVTTGGSLTISGHGNRFENIQLGCFVDINVPFTLTGDRNYFAGVHMAGIGNADAGDDTAARVLYMSDADENVFAGCTFGLDTVMRSAANTTIEVAGQIQRNVFTGCKFTMASDAETPVVFKSTGTTGLDRENEFNNCRFYNFTENDAAKVNAVFNISAQTSTADILMTGENVMVGFDDWEATNSGNLWFQGFTNTANVVGIGINPSVS